MTDQQGGVSVATDDGGDRAAAHTVRLPPPGTRWLGTSWKMTKSRAEGVQWARRVADHLRDGGGGVDVQPFVLPPATALAEVSHALALGAGTRGVLVGAQNAHWEDAGAWTGELSVPQLADAGAQLVEIGHSERRKHFAETDSTVNRKVHAALRHGLVPLVCVGETADVFAAGGSVPWVLEQVAAALRGVEDTRRVVLAYEPEWAIGEDGRPAAAGDVAPVFAALHDVWGGRLAAVLYGGSVHLGNAAGLLAVHGVDGLFVGRAAWDVEGFLSLCDVVARA